MEEKIENHENRKFRLNKVVKSEALVELKVDKKVEFYVRKLLVQDRL